MINRNLQSTFISILERNYTKADLDSQMKKVVQQFVKKHRRLCETEQVYESHIRLAETNALPKAKMCTLIAIPFSSKNLLNAFRAFLPKATRLVLDELIWTEMLSAEMIKNHFGLTVHQKKEHRYNDRYISISYELKPEFRFFKSHQNRYYSHEEPNFRLFLPVGFCKAVRPLYDKPKSAQLNPIEHIKETTHIYQGEADILLELPRVLAYQAQQQIKTTTKGKVQASTLSKMQRKLNIVEFYPDAAQKDVKYLRTSLLAALISTVSKATITEETVRQLGLLIQHNYQKQFNSIQGILTYLKGTGYIDSYYMKSIEPALFSLIKSLPTGEWVSIDNIIDFIKYNELDLKPIHEGGAESKLYYSIKTESANGYSYDQKLYVNKSKYQPSLMIPFIKGTCFLFAAYGLLDVAYDIPDTSVLGVTAQSHYDGLKYVRLNRLGAFVCAKESSYEMPNAVTTSSIRLSKDSLTIIIDKDDTTAPVILEPYTQRVSPNRFRTDYTFFLKSAKNKKDLEDKITLFKQSVKVDIPPNWETFFNELRQKINPLKAIKSTYVFQIPADNQDLLRLIAKDATLKKLCLKAEAYHIIVTKANLPKFRKRLGEFGYLLV